jgi:hypothetical protein
MDLSGTAHHPCLAPPYGEGSIILVRRDGQAGLQKATIEQSGNNQTEHHGADLFQRVEAHGAIVRKAVQAVDRDMQVIIGGSYRRGALTRCDVPPRYAAA